MEKLQNLAQNAKINSYSPYSKFRVGATLKLKDGTYICGSNIENASFGATNCAERSALFTAYSIGYRKDDIVAIAIASDNDKPISPCGICRQVICELVNANCQIYLVGQEETKILFVQDLLPMQFNADDIL